MADVPPTQNGIQPVEQAVASPNLHPPAPSPFESAPAATETARSEGNATEAASELDNGSLRPAEGEFRDAPEGGDRRARRRAMHQAELVLRQRWALKRKLATITADAELLTQEVRNFRCCQLGLACFCSDS